MSGPDGNAPVGDALPRTRSANYRDIYTNCVQIRVGQFDIALTLGMVTENPPTRLVLEDQASVIMSPQHFKALVRLMDQTLAAYERRVGPIPSAETPHKQAMAAEDILRRSQVALPERDTKTGQTEINQTAPRRASKKN